MPDISGFHSLLVTTHVVGVILFVIAHAVSAVVLLLIQRERNPETLRRLLSYSSMSLLVATIGFVAWFLAGVVAGFSGNWWTSGRLWIWAALGIAIVVTGVMTPLGRIYLNRVREALGVNVKTGKLDPAFQVDAGQVAAAVASGRPWLLAAIGIVGLVALYWLMIAKPF